MMPLIDVFNMKTINTQKKHVWCLKNFNQIFIDKKKYFSGFILQLNLRFFVLLFIVNEMTSESLKCKVKDCVKLLV